MSVYISDNKTTTEIIANNTSEKERVIIKIFNELNRIIEGFEEGK